MDYYKEVTATDLIAWFGRDEEYGAFTASLLNDLSSNADALYSLRQLLSMDADMFCPMIRPEILEQLINTVINTFGLSNAIASTYLSYMPERSARMKLSEWRASACYENDLGMMTSSRQKVLSQAMINRSFSLAHDVVDWMVSLEEAGFAKDSLSMFTRRVLAQAKLDTFLGEVEHVSRLCLTKNFLLAQKMARTDMSENELRRQVSLTLGCPGYQWPDIFDFVARKPRRSGQAAQTLKSYESVGALLLNRILSMTPEQAKSELLTDEARLMAHELGAKGVVQQMESDQSRRKALTFSFDI